MPAMLVASVPAAPPAVVPALVPLPGLGLSVDVLEDVLTAIGDREDLAGPDERARLRRGRHALERELAAQLAQW